MTVRPIYIFAGTTEGRELSCWLASRKIPCTVSVATEYGATLMPDNPLLHVCEGRLRYEDMCGAFRMQPYACVVDATHPFALTVSGEIRRACRAEGLAYYRLARRTDELPGADAVFFDSVQDAAAYLDSVQGAVLVTTGSKELPAIAAALHDTSRIFARVLPTAESIRICNDCGIKGRHIIAMQGPFSQEMNELQLKECGASFLMTKESGLPGGYKEKRAAAERCGVTAVVIRNPEKALVPEGEKAFSFSGLLAELSSLYGIGLEPERQRTLLLAGIGPGGTACITAEVSRAIAEADVLFASPRVMPEELRGTAAFVPSYRPDAVRSYLDGHPSCSHPLVLFSGDSGFYSGAASFLAEKEKAAFLRSGWKLRVLCGISTISYFSSRIGIPYQEWTLLSSHGRFCNVVGTLRFKRSCFLLVSDCRDVRLLGRKLCAARQNSVLGELRVHVGFQLGLPDEQTMRCSPEALCSMQADGLYVLLLEHAAAGQQPLVPGLPDGLFLRQAHIPMTKSETRALILCALRLTEHAVLYDIGAGTGSVSVEAARLCTGGMVYAVERNPDACALIRQNIGHFALDNVRLVQALAPDGLDELPAPSHVFVGGSDGKLKEIVRAVLAKNPSVRIVFSAITVENAILMQQLLHQLPLTDVSAVQVSVSRVEPLGSYHALKAQSPVFLVSCTGDGRGIADDGLCGADMLAEAWL